jgi:hypothetical protein
MMCRLGLRHESNSDQLLRWEKRVNDHLQALGLHA